MDRFAVFSILVLALASVGCESPSGGVDDGGVDDGGVDGGVDDGGVDDGGVDDGGVDDGGVDDGGVDDGGVDGGVDGCEEPDTPNQEQLAGQPTIAPMSTPVGTQVLAMIPVDGDTFEVLVVLFERQGGLNAGFGQATTAGNETVMVAVNVFEEATPGDYVVEIELRNNPGVPSSYTLYADPDETSSPNYDKFIVVNGDFGEPIGTSCEYATLTVLAPD